MTLETHNLVQGSAEWLAYRAIHDNASDAAAMLGISPHKTRTELLHERYLGLSREISDYVQERVMNPGHEFEALAREVAETIMDCQLFPVTQSRGMLSASLDGHSFDGRLNWEHKRLSRELADLLPAEFNGADCLPKYHRVQIEQQFMVNEAEECLFTASDWIDGVMREARHAWIFPDAELRAEIEAGWAQFHIDLAAYVPRSAEKAKPVGKTMASLPALFVMVKGKVTESNLEPWKAAALASIKSVSLTMVTDQDFADAESNVKWCERGEEACDVAETFTLSQTSTIADALKAIADVREQFRNLRLRIKPEIAARKTARKTEIVGEAVASLHKHIADLNAGLAPFRLPNIPADLAGQTARKSSFKSMQDAVDTELARAKIEASGMALRLRVNITRISDVPDFAFLFNDAADLITKDADAIAAIVKNRIHEHREAKAAEENVTRARIAAEEKEKAEAAARANAAELLRQEREAQEARDREAAAAQKKIDDDAATERRRQDAEAQAERDRAAADLAKLETPRAVDMVAESIVSSSLESFEVPGLVNFNRHVMNTPSKPSDFSQDEHAWINIGKMNEAFGFTVTADFIVTTLGFPQMRTEKAAKFWTPSQFKLIQSALIKRIQEACCIPF